MSVTGVLARGRAAHLALMLETCTVKRQTGQSMDANDVITPTYTTTLTTACRVKQFRTGHDTEAGQVAVLKRGYDVQLPWNATPAIERGDILTVTASDDPWVIGRPLIVTEVNYSGTSTARHLMVEDRS